MTCYILGEERKLCKGCQYRLLKREPSGRRFKTFVMCSHDENNTGEYCQGNLFVKDDGPALYTTNLGILSNDEIKKQRVEEKERIREKKLEYAKKWVESNYIGSSFCGFYEDLNDDTLGAFGLNFEGIKFYIKTGQIKKA